MFDDLDDWNDDRAREFYVIFRNSKAENKRRKAIQGLGKLAREGSVNAAYALRLIARSSNSCVDQELASKELAKG